ncbi:hypothetical protein GLOIN_2v1572339 [Rhizophagus clarus]|uniref:Uncharacterized protein n=1 Tax=Rhizophagus clarus TaxID=94130 RepID=A0A8H3KVI3_9GLOM|nr:hypothetical protein GLOIN_2v1572339 [Rhizophagus clarus]
MVDKKRGKRSPSINTRASRILFTKYIDSKKKALIKAGSLEQYLQHIQAYNNALCFGWDCHVFGPIIKKPLDELRIYEDETSSKTGNTFLMTIDENEDTNKLSYDPIGEDLSLNEQTAKVSLGNLSSPDPIQNLRQLYFHVASLNIPKSWGPVDISKLHYRIGTSDDSFIII